jgi:hypothetical protein
MAGFSNAEAQSWSEKDAEESVVTFLCVALPFPLRLCVEHTATVFPKPLKMNFPAH